MGRKQGDGGKNGRDPLIDRILAAYSKKPGATLDQLALTYEESAILERWIFIDGLIRKHRPNLKMGDIQSMTMRRFGISAGQFWTDLKNTDRIFGSQFALSKEYERKIMIEHFKQVASLAEVRGDYKAQIAALKEASLLMDLYNFEEQEIPENEPGKFVMALIQSSGGTRIIELDELSKLDEKTYNKLRQTVDQPLLSAETVEQMLTENDGQ